VPNELSPDMLVLDYCLHTWRLALQEKCAPYSYLQIIILYCPYNLDLGLPSKVCTEYFVLHFSWGNACVT